ncbi:MAG TPA: GvpL/GvpF family gas vesicle protein [Thermoleophilaceae bacterium]|nr:GvpL/GvpF family gas vesicle protein [Thermoleophilaceae bacterium]
MTAVYVYGIAPAAEPTNVEAPGVGEEHGGVRRIVHRELAALVSDVDEGPLVAARGLRAHWRVLEEAVATATVLPVRFGTVMESDDAVVEQFLAPRHDRLVALLAELSGKVQLSVKAFYDEEQLLRGVLESSPAVAKMRERVMGRPKAATYYDRIQLGEAVAGEVERARERDSAMMLGRLEPLAVAARLEPPGTPDAAVNAAFLVQRSRVDEFSEAVGRLGDEVQDRMRIRYLGPLPPYSFTEEQEAVGAWA